MLGRVRDGVFKECVEDEENTHTPEMAVGISVVRPSVQR